MRDSLHDNHATIISLFCVDRTHFPAQDTWYHYLIAFKYKWTDEQGEREIVELYNPQTKRYVREFGPFLGYGIVGKTI